MTTQEIKEETCLMAIQLGMGLIRRGREVYGMYADASTELIATSSSAKEAEVWACALTALRKYHKDAHEHSRTV